MMYKLNNTCNLSLGKFYITVQLWLRMMLEWISEPLVFGDVHITRPFFMTLGCLALVSRNYLQGFLLLHKGCPSWSGILVSFVADIN